jgi:hypothetical protein
MQRLFWFGQRANFMALAVIVGAATLIVACGGTNEDSAPTAVVDQPADTVVAVQPDPTATATAAIEPSSTPESPTADPTPVPEPTAIVVPQIIIEDDAERSRAERLRTTWGWATNLDERTISLSELEIVLPRDRIVPIDEPVFVAVADAPEYRKTGSQLSPW